MSRTITKQYEIFTLKEMLNNPETKQKLLEKHYDINVDYYDWHKFILDEWQDKLDDIGFSNPEINYTGFNSQGDGASFTCKEIDFIKMCKYLNYNKRESNLIYELWNQGYIEAAVKRNNYHYYHENTVTLEYYDGHLLISWKHIQKLVDKLWNDIESLIKPLCCEIYRDLENEYEYLISEKAIIETLQANEYEFYSDGTIA